MGWSGSGLTVLAGVLFLAPLAYFGELGVWSFDAPRSHLEWDEGGVRPMQVGGAGSGSEGQSTGGGGSGGGSGSQSPQQSSGGGSGSSGTSGGGSGSSGQSGGGSGFGSQAETQSVNTTGSFGSGGADAGGGSLGSGTNTGGSTDANSWDFFAGLGTFSVGIGLCFVFAGKSMVAAFGYCWHAWFASMNAALMILVLLALALVQAALLAVWGATMGVLMITAAGVIAYGYNAGWFGAQQQQQTVVVDLRGQQPPAGGAPPRRPPQPPR